VDRSLEYAKMCEGAYPDIETIYRPVFSRRRRMLYTNGAKSVCRWDDVVNTSNYKHWWPLYEQDQLQEMVGEGIADWAGGIECFYHNGEYPYECSWEMFWLCYVMDKKFNKTWNGKEWQ